MKKISEIFNKYQILTEICVVFCSFMLLAILFSSRINSFLIDIGREAYIPQIMLNGKVLYKDIFNLFGPLSYQLNTIWYYLLGSNLRTMQLIGLFNSLIIVFLLYFISRFFLDKKLSFLLVLFFQTVCVFSYTTNYIFPYAYAMIYSLEFVLFSILFLFLYLKSSNKYYLILASFFAGATVVTKYEFFIFVGLLLVFIIYKNKNSISQILYNLFAFISVPVISFVTLFLQGMSLNDFLNNMSLVKKYSLSNSLYYFHSTITGTYFSFDYFKSEISILVLKHLLLLAFICFVCYKVTKSKLANIPKIFIYTGIIGLIYLLRLVPVFLYFPYFISVLFIVKTVSKIKNRTLFENDNFYLLNFIAILISLKTLWFMNVSSYGVYTIPLCLILLFVFILEYLPKYFKQLDKEILKKTLCIIVLVISLMEMYKTAIVVYKFRVPIKTEKGTIYDDFKVAYDVKDMLKYFENDKNRDAKILSLPEGAMINFITNRDIGLYNYISLIPPYIEAFGQDKIIEDIEKEKIDYIIVANRSIEEYDKNVEYMCKYDKTNVKICDYIKEKYNFVNHDIYLLDFSLYKRK